MQIPFPRLLPALRRLVPLAAAVLLAGVSEPASAASSNGAPVSLGMVGSWEIAKMPTWCSGIADFANGTQLTFSIGVTGGAIIVVGSHQWNIPKGDYPVTAWVDRSQPFTFTGHADGQIVVLPWGVTPDEINLMSYGAQLHVTVGRQTYHYGLVRSADMLSSVGRCVGDLMAASNPFSGTKPTAPTPAYQPAVINPFSGG